ncbi:MAG: thioredoxin [Clostridiales bacterium]|nr:MAG: thioredoxin [Clostridiales bacterium]
MSVIHLTKENFDQEVLQAKEPVLIDFFANWCGPCKMVAPIIEEIAAETTDKKICKVNIDEQPALAEQFGVMSIPTLVVVKEGRVVNKSVGAKSKKAILEFLNG